MLHERHLLTSRWDATRSGLVHARHIALPGVERAPAVVLVHGLGMSSLYWTPAAAHLARHVRVLAVDLPGFGRSAKPTHTLTVPELAEVLSGWLEALDLGRVVLVGHSLGCQVIAEMMVRHAHPVEAVVLASPAMDPHARTAGEQVGRWLRDWRHEPPAAAAINTLDFARAGLGRVWKTMLHELDHPMADRLPHLAVPTLVVRGTQDPIIPQRWAEEAAALLPQGRLHVLHDAPHMLNYTHADAFVGLVQSFLREA